MFSDVERLWRLIDRAPDGCWNWKGFCIPSGYGRLCRQIQGKPRVYQAHRYIYELLVEPIPDGMELDHLCRNRACVNPAHLEIVTHYENIMRGDTIPARHAAKSSCPEGHPYDKVSGHSRRCSTCDKAKVRAWHEHQRFVREAT